MDGGCQGSMAARVGKPKMVLMGVGSRGRPSLSSGRSGGRVPPAKPSEPAAAALAPDAARGNKLLLPLLPPPRSSSTRDDDGNAAGGGGVAMAAGEGVGGVAAAAGVGGGGVGAVASGSAAALTVASFLKMARCIS